MIHIGILGGSGALAGAWLFQLTLRLWTELSGATSDDDFPEFTLRSIGTGLDHYGRGDVTPQWTAAAAELAGCQLVLVGCNSLSPAVSELQRTLPGLEWDNPLELSLRELKIRGVQEVTVRCSRTARDAGLFEAAAPEGLRVIASSDTEQDRCDWIIGRATAGLDIPQSELSWLRSGGTLLGCSELSMVADPLALQQGAHWCSLRLSTEAQLRELIGMEYQDQPQTTTALLTP